MSHEQVWQTREILGAALAQEQPNQPRSVLSCMILREGGITLQDLTGKMLQLWSMKFHVSSCYR